MKLFRSSLMTVDVLSGPRSILLLRASLALTLGGASISFGAADLPRTWRVSVDSDGVEANERCSRPVVSANGRYVVFHSEADNLVEGDTNRFQDVFLHDRFTGNTEMISVGSDGQQGNESSWSPRGRITPDGRFVAFTSGAWNFDKRDFEGAGNGDVFVRDRTLGLTILVSVSSNGVKGNGSSTTPSISADGRYVVFHGAANNLVRGDTNERLDVFVHDRDADDNGVFDEEGGISTIRISMGYNGGQAYGSSQDARVTPDGRFIVFDSDATHLVREDTNGVRDVFVHDRDADEDGVFDEPGAVETVRVSVGNGWESESASWRSSISADGRFIAFESSGRLVGPDFNKAADVFIHDRKDQFTRLVTLGIGGRAE